MKKILLLLLVFSAIQEGALAQEGCQPDVLASRVFSAIQKFDSTDIDEFRKVLISDKEIQVFIESMDGDNNKKERLKERIKNGLFDDQLSRMFDRLVREIRQAKIELNTIEYEDFLYQIRRDDGIKQLKGEVYFQGGERHFAVRVMAAMVNGEYAILEIEDVEESYELHGYPESYQLELEEVVPDYGHEEVTVEMAEEIVEVCEEEPSFGGGNSEMQRYIIDNIQYPLEAIEQNIQGKVYLSFVVEKSGNISNVEVIRSVHPLLDKEASRLVRNMPNWSPGKVANKPVRARVRLPIAFMLSDK